MPKDFADEAQEINETFLETSIKAHKTLTIPFSGFCLCCEAKVGQRRYCDADCRDLHQHSLKLQMITGNSTADRHI